MDISDRLKSVRSFLGKTQRDMAVSCGVSLGSWQAYEAGSSYPGGRVLEELARLGVNTNWVLIEDGEMMRPLDENEERFPFDKEILVEVMVKVEKVFSQLSKPWPTEKKAELIILLHDEIADGLMEPEEIERTVLRVVKLAS